MMVEEHESVSDPGLRLSTLAEISPNAWLRSLASFAPSGVGVTLRGPRDSSAKPKMSSRLLMWRLIAPCVTDNSAAAADMLASRTVASKALSALSEGFVYMG
jgi:hypothetical protein